MSTKKWKEDNKEKMKAYRKKHYENNRSYYISKAKKYNKDVINEINKYITDYLKTHPCVDC